MNKLKIGVYAYSTGENSFGVAKNYLDFISQFGSPKIITPDEYYRDDLDALVLVGGADLSPSSYGQYPNFYTSNTDVFKQHVYDNCLPNYVANGKKILGICLGMQQLACYFGSKLTQHLPFHTQSDYDAKPAHDVISDLGTFKVTSTHHQGVIRNELSDKLEVLAFARNEEYSNVKSKDPLHVDIVEVFKHKDLPIIGVQSHPERYCEHILFKMIKNVLS